MTHDWRSVYRIDRRFPADLCHNGHSYARGYGRRDSKITAIALEWFRPLTSRRERDRATTYEVTT